MNSKALFDQAVMLQQRGALAEAEQCYRALLADDPLHVDAWNNLAVMLSQSGDDALAIKHWRRALSIDPSNAGVRKNLNTVSLRMASRYLSAGAYDDSCSVLREILRREPANTSASAQMVEALYRAKQRAEPSDVGLQGQLKGLLIASLPFCGGGYVAQAMRARNVGTHFNGVFARNPLREELSALAINQAVDHNVLLHHAAPATAVNLALIQAANMRVAVVARDALDLVYNFASCDDITKYVWPIKPDTWRSSSRAARVDMAIDWVLPAWIEFTSTWIAAQHEQRCPVLWVDYAELKNNTTEVLLQITQFVGHEVSYYQWASTVAMQNDDDMLAEYGDPIPGCGKNLPGDVRRRISNTIARYGIGT